MWAWSVHTSAAQGITSSESITTRDIHKAFIFQPSGQSWSPGGWGTMIQSLPSPCPTSWWWKAGKIPCIGCAWDLASWAGLSCHVSQHLVGANPSVPPLVVSPPAPCVGEETTWGSWPGTNELAGFQEPATMSSNTISVKQQHCRAHVWEKLKDRCVGIPCCRSAACPDHSSPSYPPGDKAFPNVPSPNLAPWSTPLLTRSQKLAHFGSNSCFHSGLIRLHANKDPNPLFLCVL